MEIYQLKSFIAVAEEKNLTRAAERLFSSQPAISSHIKSLETELGVILFSRTPRGMVITSDGEKLLEQSLEILTKVGDLNNLARDLQAQPTGVLRVGINMDGDDLKLGLIAEQLHKRYPEVSLEFIYSGSGAIHKAILDGELDVGFFEGIVESPLISKIPVGKTEVLVVGSHKYSDNFASQEWQALEELPWIFNTPECSFNHLIQRISKANNLELNKRFTTDHEATSLHFVRKGMGISLTNVELVRKEIEDEQLIAWPGYRGVLDVQLLCLSKRAEERAIKAFFQSTKLILKIN